LVARVNVMEFQRRGVGLCVVTSTGVYIEIEAPRRVPLQAWLRESAVCYVESEGGL
jgi:hypothetical protein